jgi:hypothetical protein
LIPFLHRICILPFIAIVCIFALFWHILRFLLALFRTFWCINREISTKKAEEGQKRENSAKSAMQMQNANAMQ